MGLSTHNKSKIWNPQQFLASHWACVWWQWPASRSTRLLALPLRNWEILLKNTKIKEEGRRRKKEEGRRKKEEGRFFLSPHLPISLSPSLPLSLSPHLSISFVNILQRGRAWFCGAIATRLLVNAIFFRHTVNLYSIHSKNYQVSSRKHNG